jgi:hypothetical protein
MAFSRIPKRPIGYVPKKDFADEGTGQFYATKVGTIIRVDEINMKADIQILTGGGFRFEVDLTQGLAGPRSFWGGVPEVNSVVIIGYRRLHKNLWDAVILGYLPTGNRSGLRFDPFSAYDPSTVTADDKEETTKALGGTTRYKRLLMRPGDVGGMSSGGSELVLSKDVRMVNRAGDFLELRDAERTWVAQSVHRVESESGVRRLSGPIRRSKFFLPEDILKEGTRTLRDRDTKYYGREELQSAGPGITPGKPPKYALTNGNVLDLFNNFTEFPAVTYSNGRKVHYPPTSPALSIEDIDTPAADAFVEYRMEMSQSSDLSQEVLEEIDGFQMDRRLPYIEQVYGTVVGNDFNSVRGQRQYARILKPRIFTDFNSVVKGKFTLDEVIRQPTNDLEAFTNAGAYLFRMRPPRSTGDNVYAYAVTKEGKVYLNIPGSTVESYSGKNVSAEVNMAGALKAYIGASAPDRNSINAVLEGGIKAVIGHNASGNALDITYRSAVKVEYGTTTPNDSDMAYEMVVRGRTRKIVSGIDQEQAGSKEVIVDGGYQLHADRLNINAFQGFGGNFGEIAWMVSGKSQYNYALAVLENIILGGKISTILAGGLVQNIIAGGEVHNVTAGGALFSVAAGGFTATVGTGVVALTTGAGAVTLSTASGALSIGAAAGAISIAAGLALTLTAVTAITLTAPQVLLGAPIAALGVCRGVPSLPPNTPTLDPITNIPLLGSLSVRSI